MDMWKLIKLEYRKNNIKKYLWGAVAAAVLLGIFMFALAFLGIANDPDTGVPDAAPGNEVISASVELFTSRFRKHGCCIMLFYLRPVS